MGNKDKDTLLSFNWVEDEKLARLGDESLTFARLLISGTLENIEKIDSVIKESLSEKWDFDRLSKVDLSILRISVYPLLFQKDIHPTIVIDEAIEIAKEYGSDDSFKFINAVLDYIRKSNAALA